MSRSELASDKRMLRRANPRTIQDKLLVGYQGWFTCGGDGEPVGPGHHGWLHWFDAPIPHGGRPNMDLWPDVSSYSPSELFPAPGLKTRSGEQVFLFSSRHPKSVQRHFHWMAEHGVDGAFLQRFVGQCDIEAGCEGIMKIRDEVGDRVREAAEKEGRVFALMYDVSGVAPDRVQRVIERDWLYLIRNKGILDSPNYLTENGKAVVALWGFGFDGRGHTPALVRSITSYIRNVTPGGAYIMAGAPAHWRTNESDADRNPEFLDVWLNEFDAISPWTVGRYTDEQGADHFAETKMKGDVELIQRHNAEGSHRKIDYIPVVLPGGSGFNLSRGKWGFNDIKRKGGRFLWRQIFNAKHHGAHTIYGAMWDEYDEGTAFMPVVENKSMLPVSDKFPFLALDEDGYDLPSDWYMRICGFAVEGLKNERRIHETFPVKELQDYWSSRPRYEDPVPSSQIDAPEFKDEGSRGGEQSYQAWLKTEKEVNEEAPPPPYSLEAEAVAAASSQPSPSIAESTSSNPPSALGTISVAGSSQLQSTAALAYGNASAASGPQVETFTKPPPVNMSSRPQVSYMTPPTIAPSDPTHAVQAAKKSDSVPTDSVSTLTNDFGKMGVSPQRPLSVSNASVAPQPPPLHPAHPKYGKRPQTSHASFPVRPGIVPPPPLQTRPGSQAGSAYSSPTVPGQSPSQGYQRPPFVPSAPNQWSSGAPFQQTAPSVMQEADPAQNAGANLSRPHTFSASVATSRPPGTIGPTPSQVSPDTSPNPGVGPYLPSASSQSYGLSPSSPYSPGVGAPFPSAGPPSAHGPGPNAGAPLFPSGPNSYAYPPFGSTYPDQIGSSVYPAQSPPSGPAFPVGPYQNFSSGQGSSFVGQPAYGGPGQGPAPYGVAQQSYFPNVGASQGESVHFPQAQFSPTSPMQGYQPSPGFSSYYGQQGSDAPYGGTSSSSEWFPGASHNPPMPPRPAGPYGYPTYQVAPVPGTSSASPAITSGPLGFALDAVDKVAGKKTREQLESMAQSGTKLFNKLTR